MKIDARRRQEHQKENKIVTHKTDEDTKVSQKGLEEEICVVTWNVNKSSAQYAFLLDMAHCQTNVVMFQETHNWHEDGTAEELGWNLMKEGKTAIAVRKKNPSLLRYCFKKLQMDSYCSWKYSLSLDVLAAHLGR